MPSDDHPIDALRRQQDMEELSGSPFTGVLLEVLSYFPWPGLLGRALDRLKMGLVSNSDEWLRVLVVTCADEIKRQDGILDRVQSQIDSVQHQLRVEVCTDLMLDAARRAVSTRSKNRVKRIGLILTNGALVVAKPDADETEELMRVAMDLSDLDIKYLGELVRIQGTVVKDNGRITRHDAFTRWTSGFWSDRPDGCLDSVFSKLESYGLVVRIPPPNNQNIFADIQNRYALLSKGLRFVELSRSTASEP